MVSYHKLVCSLMTGLSMSHNNLRSKGRMLRWALVSEKAVSKAKMRFYCGHEYDTTLRLPYHEYFAGTRLTAPPRNPAFPSH